MNEDIKREWVKRLRSGNYKQGTGYLQKDGEFCCLGVLCEIAVKQGIIPAPTVRPTHGDGPTVMAYGNFSGTTTSDVDQWAGFDEHGRTQDRLARMNDTGSTFAEIADEIERTL